MNIAQLIGSGIDNALAARLTRATVDSNDTDQIYVTRIGYSTPDGRSYPKLDGVTVVAGDEVLMVDLTGRGGWIVLGKILRN